LTEEQRRILVIDDEQTVRDFLQQALAKAYEGYLREKIIMKLKFYEDLSQTEIAKRLRISQMHVSRLQRKALTQLKLILPG